MGYITNGLSFRTLRNASEKRAEHPAYANCKNWTEAHWLKAMVGEVGEYANLSKKYDRGDISETEFKTNAAKELADIAIYLDRLASNLGIHLGNAVREKFNEVSERIGSPVYIGLDDDWHLKK